MNWKCMCGNWIELKMKITVPSTCKCPFCSITWSIYPEIFNNPIHCYDVDCNPSTLWRFGAEDGDYGHHCFKCNKSLRQHPFMGEGKEFDKGDSFKWYIWCQFNDTEKDQVYKRYGFKFKGRKI